MSKPDHATRRQRVLILKTGYSETLDPDTSGVVSLGDILRTTVVLHAFPPEEYEVTWLVDPKGVNLLKGNPRIERILTVNPFTPFHLMSEWFDVVANFEKDPGICAMADKISAWRRYGFRFDHQSREAHAYDHADTALSMSKDHDFKRAQSRSWSQVLFETLGRKYNGESYLLGYEPRTTEIFDIGLNHLVGGKYPIKRWPAEKWQRLHEELSVGYRVSWQEGVNNIEEYIDWINSCRLLVTNDSLGLHLALALGKKVVALFGPTKDNEIDDRETLIKLLPDVDWNCIPCIASSCRQKGRSCMEHIGQERVLEAIDTLLSAKHN